MTMMREKKFEILEKAEFTRIKQCCEGVPSKLCSLDEWRGHMDALFYEIEQEVQRRTNDALTAVVASCGTALQDLATKIQDKGYGYLFKLTQSHAVVMEIHDPVNGNKYRYIADQPSDNLMMIIRATNCIESLLSRKETN